MKFAEPTPRHKVAKVIVASPFVGTACTGIATFVRIGNEEDVLDEYLEEYSDDSKDEDLEKKK